MFDKNEEAVSGSGGGCISIYNFLPGFPLENFEYLYTKVLDPIWLVESDHSNSIALRATY